MSEWQAQPGVRAEQSPLPMLHRRSWSDEQPGGGVRVGDQSPEIPLPLFMLCPPLKGPLLAFGSLSLFFSLLFFFSFLSSDRFLVSCLLTHSLLFSNNFTYSLIVGQYDTALVALLTFTQTTFLFFFSSRRILLFFTDPENHQYAIHKHRRRRLEHWQRHCPVRCQSARRPSRRQQRILDLRPRQCRRRRWRYGAVPVRTQEPQRRPVDLRLALLAHRRQLQRHGHVLGIHASRRRGHGCAHLHRHGCQQDAHVAVLLAGQALPERHGDGHQRSTGKERYPHSGQLQGSRS
ncbi:hypothetical protein PVAG01_03419 [Phlyctema vagabunda]|uniref:Uncharacterized protein n=1 Tax=Phlyctema vagabunda TaxID=108571 RepID=A0ABR4PLD4_9HELO